jgi:hypothetical protein
MKCGALAVGARDQLATAVQGALDASQSSAVVQPGELYLSQLDGAVVATQPLRATLTYGRPDFIAPGGPCEPRNPALPCRFPGQDCLQVCAVPQPSPAVARAPGERIAAALVVSIWYYTTLRGQVVGDHYPDTTDIGFAVLRITWDGASWHVRPILGLTPGLPVADDLVCTSARFWLEHNGSWAFMLTNPPPGAQAQFVSDMTPSDGCLVMLDPLPGSDVPAVFLERFGVLLAVNAAANEGGANLTMADSAEQSLAHHLATQAQLTFGNTTVRATRAPEWLHPLRVGHYRR